MSKKTSNKGTTRTRNYATVVYPESAPNDWIEILTQQFVPCFISPLHDKDTNPTGEPKKPHYHVLIAFDGVKTSDQAKAIFEKIGGVGCEVVQSLRGYARYLCHLDNPEKAQYDTRDVRCLSGTNYDSVIGLPTDKYQAIRDMIKFCEENDIISYRKLLLYAECERDDWFKVLCDNGSYVMKEYLKSCQWERNLASDNDSSE